MLPDVLCHLDRELLEKPALPGKMVRSIKCRGNCYKQNITLEDMAKSIRYEDFCEGNEANCRKKFVNVILPETGGTSPTSTSPLPPLSTTLRPSSSTSTAAGCSEDCTPLSISLCEWFGVNC